MSTHRINWLAVLVAALAGTFVGFLWYGLIFESVWADAVGIMEVDGVYTKDGTELELDPVMPMVINFIVLVIYAAFFSWLTARSGHIGYVAGAGLGAVTGIVVALGHYITNMFASDPLALTLVDGPYHIVLFAVIGAIVGGWGRKAAT